MKLEMDAVEYPLPGYRGYNPEFAARALKDVKAREKQRREAEALAAAEKRERAKAEIEEMEMRERQRGEAEALEAAKRREMARAEIEEMHESERAINRMKAHADMRALREEVLARPGRPNARRIIMNVAHGTGLTADDILGPSRLRCVVEVRQRAMHTVRKLRPDFSLLRIAALFNRDHTTVLHALRKIDALDGNAPLAK